MDVREVGQGEYTVFRSIISECVIDDVWLNARLTQWRDKWIIPQGGELSSIRVSCLNDYYFVAFFSV